MESLPETLPTNLVLYVCGGYFVLAKLVIGWLLKERSGLISKLEARNEDHIKFITDLWRGEQGGEE